MLLMGLSVVVSPLTAKKIQSFLHKTFPPSVQFPFYAIGGLEEMAPSDKYMFLLIILLATALFKDKFCTTFNHAYSCVTDQLFPVNTQNMSQHMRCAILNDNENFFLCVCVEL